MFENITLVTFLRDQEEKVRNKITDSRYALHEHGIRL